jgi:hypothetical protein
MPFTEIFLTTEHKTRVEKNKRKGRREEKEEEEKKGTKKSAFHKLHFHFQHLKITIVFDVVRCSLVDRYQHFGDICCFLLQGMQDVFTKLHAVTSHKIVNFISER